MKIKTRHSKYQNFKTLKQLLSEGLTPSDDGVELWTNGYCNNSAVYHDAKKAQKIEEIIIWNNYLSDPMYPVPIEVGVIDINGNILFESLIKPSNYWLKERYNADNWVFSVTKELKYPAYEMLTAKSTEAIQKKLVKQITKLPYLKRIISYNNEFNVPDDLKKQYQQIDVMELFAKIADEKFDNGAYKWQKLDKCLHYYELNVQGKHAPAYANAIYQCYLNMKNN